MPINNNINNNNELDKKTEGSENSANPSEILAYLKYFEEDGEDDYLEKISDIQENEDLVIKGKKSTVLLVMNHPHHHCQLQRFNSKIFAIIRKKGSGNEDLVNEIEIVSVSSFARWLDNSGVMKFFIIFILGLRINFFPREV